VSSTLFLNGKPSTQVDLNSKLFSLLENKRGSNKIHMLILLHTKNTTGMKEANANTYSFTTHRGLKMTE